MGAAQGVGEAWVDRGNGFRSGHGDAWVSRSANRGLRVGGGARGIRVLPRCRAGKAETGIGGRSGGEVYKS
jgi:hypothetical protein